jgi:serine/threonine protein kinase
MDELPGLCTGGGQTREPSVDGGEVRDWSSESGDTAAASELATSVSPAGLSEEELDARTREAASDVRPFADSGLEMVRTLQEAPRNQGRVDLMRVVSTGRFVAVKRMPNSWVRTGPEDFAASHDSTWFWGGGSLERPWVDIGLSGCLHARGFPHACEQFGIFRDHEFTYVSSAFCSGGDLFGMMDRDPSPGEARESQIRPIMLQVFSAVRWLHSRGIAHRDISLENILLGGDRESEVKLIDFGMATLSRTCKESCGKRSYTAPEMLKGPHDPFSSDAFAVGVVLFSLASRAYPWHSTRPGSCRLFDFVCQYGFRRFLKKRRVWKGKGDQTLSQVFSEPLVRLAEGLLSMEPADRTTICGQRFPGDVDRPSVWDAEWLRAAPTV